MARYGPDSSYDQWFDLDMRGVDHDVETWDVQKVAMIDSGCLMPNGNWFGRRKQSQVTMDLVYDEVLEAFKEWLNLVVNNDLQGEHIRIKMCVETKE